MSAAVKLLIGQLVQLTHAEKKLRTTGGLEFQRAWVQGRIVSVSPDNTYFEVTDGTGPPLTVCYRASAGEHLLGEYVLIVGKLGLKRSARRDDAGRSQEDEQERGKGSGKRRKEWQLAGQKVKRLAGPTRRAALWQHEVTFLHEHVYPTMARSG